MFDGDVFCLDVDGVVVAVGEIDHGSMTAFDAVVQDALATFGRLTLDLSGVTFMDSSGVGIIARAVSRGNGSQPVRIRNASKPVLRVLAITGVDKVVAFDEFPADAGND